MENKTTSKNKVHTEEIDLIKNVRRQELGFDDITEYFAYLDRVEEQYNEQEAY